MTVIYKHPCEDECLHALIKNNVVRMLLDVYHQFRAEISDFAEIRSRNFRVTAQNWPGLYSIFQTAVSRLHIRESVSLYTEFSYGCTVHTVGTDDDAAIIISSACVEQMSDSELMALIGRELTHIQCHHLTYLNMTSLLETLLPKIPFVGAAAAETAKGLLLSWSRYAEMTADRGGAITTGSADYVVDAVMLQIGGKVTKYSTAWTPGKECSVSMQIEDGILFNTVVQRITANMDVPFGMLRIQDLIRWSSSKICEAQIPYVYYNSGYGKNLPMFQSGQQDLHDAVCAEETNRRLHLLLLHRAARAGNTQAMFRVGRIYLGSQNVFQTSLAVDCIQKSALAGDPDGQYVLGILYKNGVPGCLSPNSQMSQWLIRLAYGQEQADAVLKARSKPISVPHIEEMQLRKVLRVTNHIMPELASQLHRRLWIPPQDSIICAEVTDTTEDLYEAIAICTTGIYLRTPGQSPAWIDWFTFFHGKKNAQVSNGQVYILMDDRRLWHGNELDKSSIVYKIAMLSKMIT